MWHGLGWSSWEDTWGYWVICWEKKRNDEEEKSIKKKKWLCVMGSLDKFSWPIQSHSMDMSIFFIIITFVLMNPFFYEWKFEEVKEKNDFQRRSLPFLQSQQWTLKRLYAQFMKIGKRQTWAASYAMGRNICLGQVWMWILSFHQEVWKLPDRICFPGPRKHLEEKQSQLCWQWKTAGPHTNPCIVS